LLEQYIPNIPNIII